MRALGRARAIQSPSELRARFDENALYEARPRLVAAHTVERVSHLARERERHHDARAVLPAVVAGPARAAHTVTRTARRLSSS